MSIQALPATDLLNIDALERLREARHHDPFSVLGKHPHGAGIIVRAHIPGVTRVWIEDNAQPMTRIPGTDVFTWTGSADSVPDRYQLGWETVDGHQHVAYDPYCFPPQISDFDLHLFGEGRHWHAYRIMGAHMCDMDGVAGVRYAVWAPSAGRVSVVCDANNWDGRVHPMRVLGGSGLWELFLPGMQAGDLYRYEIRNRDSGSILLKTDPYAQAFELRPSNASMVTKPDDYLWQDGVWMKQREKLDWQHAPLSIYEVHLGSWQRDDKGQFLNYREIAARLVPYVKDMGFTHIELLPITEHPLDASWGYQTTGYFAPTSRFGSPDDFRYFMDHCHANDIGVILDWVPAHFPKDAHGLARFDGSALYEHEDPRRGEHQDWGTLIYNYQRKEVKNFLLSSAVYWLEEFHIDGLRVDAVASMLYLDYSREAGEWLPNAYGGRENLEAIDFLRELNEVAHGQHPGCMVIAEESTSWPQVTRPNWVGGLGFSMKWNMGWMHDTLLYISKDPVFRCYEHNQLTFGMLYAFTENFLLPFSHDEVVHGKGSMINKMPGDDWQRFANLRLLYSYQYTYPGKKLMFMGCEFAQFNEWNVDTALDWPLDQYDRHAGIRNLVSDVNHLYRDNSALFQYDFEGQGFEWIDCHDAAQSVVSYLRRSDQQTMIVAINFTPVPRDNYRLGVPQPGFYREVFNSDSKHYGGSNIGNSGGIEAQGIAWMNRPFSITLTLPPLSVVVLEVGRD